MFEGEDEELLKHEGAKKNRALKLVSDIMHFGLTTGRLTYFSDEANSFELLLYLIGEISAS